MNWQWVFETIWTALNSPAAIAAAAAVLIWVLKRLYAAKPAWKRFEGTIIAAVKWAEKEVPDTVDNTAVARFDEAMRYVLKIYAETQGKPASPKLVDSLREGIQVTHAKLENDLALHGAKTA